MGSEAARRRKEIWRSCPHFDVVLVVLGVTCVGASLERGAADHGAQNLLTQLLPVGAGHSGVAAGKFWEWRLPVGCDFSGFFIEMLGCLAELINQATVALNTGACSEAMLASLAPGEERAVRWATAVHAAASELPHPVIHDALQNLGPDPNFPPTHHPSKPSTLLVPGCLSPLVMVAERIPDVLLQHSEPCSWEVFPPGRRPGVVIGRTMVEAPRGARPRLMGTGSASLGVADFSQVDVLGLRCTPVNLGAGKGPGSRTWWAHVH